ncbi:hypothetical protein [Natrinema sp. SYSU A 869]|uniref:hypothetical protein n=1 Tax=Natrinema sp. SYSU A 869 TaxID=2871694 RepID=UPI001CA3BCAF|nr:hypothetical protein [Natrinema sp. SYSU A 869]
MDLQLLFSYMTLVGLLFLVAVVAASYAGTTIALKRFFRAETRKLADNDPQ